MGRNLGLAADSRQDSVEGQLHSSRQSQDFLLMLRNRFKESKPNIYQFI